MLHVILWYSEVLSYSVVYWHHISCHTVWSYLSSCDTVVSNLIVWCSGVLSCVIRCDVICHHVVQWYLISSCDIVASYLVSYSVKLHVDGLIQERRNSIANALELCLSCTYPSMPSSDTMVSYTITWYSGIISHSMIQCSLKYEFGVHKTQSIARPHCDLWTSIAWSIATSPYHFVILVFSCRFQGPVRRPGSHLITHNTCHRICVPSVWKC